MNEDLHPIDDLFRSGLEGKEDAPTPKVWENIEAELNKKEKRPAAGFFGRKAAAALVVLLGSAALFAAGYFFGGGNHRHNNDDGLPVFEPSTPRSARGDSSSKNTTIGIFPEETPGSTPAAEAGNPSATGDPLKEAMREPGSATEKQKENVDVNIAEAGETVPLVEQSRTATGIAPAVTKKKQRNNRQQATNKEQEATSYSASGKEMQRDAEPSTTAGEPAPERPPMIHRAAESEAVPEVHPLPLVEKKLNTSSARQASATLPETAKKYIPVSDKKKGHLDLPIFSLTPIVAYQSNRNAVKDDGTRWGYEMKEGIEETEHSPARISGGILADLRVSRNVTLQTGLVFMQKDVHIDPKRVWAVKDIDGKVRYRFDCSAGTYFLNPKQGNNPRPGDTSTTRFSSNALNYINIPINIKWHFGNSKLQFFATAGAGMNFLMQQELNATLNHQYHYEGGRATNLRSSFFNGSIGIGMNYSLGSRFGLSLSPQYQFAITPMNENMPVKAMPRSVSVQAGLQIKLN